MLTNFKHQTDVIERFKDDSRGAIFLEMGLGKSRIAIKIAEHQFNQKNITAVMIVMPKSLLTNWANIEIPTHSDNPYSIYMWHGKEKTAFKNGQMQYFLVNHDAIITDNFNPIFKQFYTTHKKFMLVAEESTGFKSIKAKRTKRIISIASLATSKFLLTGAPITQSPLDVFSQFEILSPMALGHKNIFSFRAKYAVIKKIVLGPRSFDKIVGYQNLSDLTARINKLGVIMKKEDILDLPEIMFRKFPVELTAEQSIAYEDLRDRALAYIRDNEISAINAVSLINKLLQICSGQVKMPDKAYINVETNRIEALQELVEEHAGKTVIWSAFVRSGHLIAEALGDQCVHVRAEHKQEERFALLEQFRKGDKKALVMNPASGGMGITLIESSNVIYYDRSYNYEHRIQSLARNHRIGQTKGVLVTDMYSPGTIEEKVIEILKEKERIANLVINNEFVKDLLQ